MNVVEIGAKRQSFLRIYQHEISRRRQIKSEKPKAYAKIFSANDKGLLDCCPPHMHIWVPMTHLWIHDGAGSKYKIGGFDRRGFREAMPYKIEGYRVIPQMCWNCIHTRELITEVTPWGYRSVAQQIILDNNGKKRGKPGSDIMMHDLSDIMDNTVVLV